MKLVTLSFLPLIIIAFGLCPPVFAEGFNQTLSLQGISFHVTCPNQGSMNTLRITPRGLKEGNEVISQDVEGTVTMAEVADINSDGSPEIYVYVTSAGSGSYGTLVGYSANRKKRLTEIYLPPLNENPNASKGYRGHDAFSVVEGYIVRHFPVYLDQDTNAQPTGGVRQIQYKLKAGEAGWILRMDQYLTLHAQ
jgi:hypothetical protein